MLGETTYYYLLKHGYQQASIYIYIYIYIYISIFRIYWQIELNKQNSKNLCGMWFNICSIAMSYHLKSNDQQNMIWLQQGSNYNLTNNSLSFCVSDDQLIKSFKYMQVETQNDANIVKEPNTIKVINGKEVHSLSHCLYLTYLKSNIHNRGGRCPCLVVHTQDHRNG